MHAQFYNLLYLFQEMAAGFLHHIPTMAPYLEKTHSVINLLKIYGFLT